ncbi:hypothetical protein [Candidatus Sororendozoicomonas aggregata]|uniref:hypothetical protein n=1 Tax=Candidatus Sororendozoicomonas aggregata TaxID=3073239 RepID=UPI002ED57A02
MDDNSLEITWAKEDLQVIPIFHRFHQFDTVNINGFSIVSSKNEEYVQGFLFRGDCRPFNTVFLKGFTPKIQIGSGFDTPFDFETARGVIASTSYIMAEAEGAKIHPGAPWYVYMVDAQRKLGIPMMTSRRNNREYYPEVNVLEGFPGTDVVGFIHRSEESQMLELVCNPDYSGDFAKVRGVINNPTPKPPRLRKAPTYSGGFLNDNYTVQCTIL